MCFLVGAPLLLGSGVLLVVLRQSDFSLGPEEVLDAEPTPQPSF